MKKTSKILLTSFFAFQYTVFAVLVLLRVLYNDIDLTYTLFRALGEASEFIHDVNRDFISGTFTEAGAFPTVLLGFLAIIACIYMAVICRKNVKYSIESLCFAVLCCVAYKPLEFWVIGVIFALALVYSIIKFIYIAKYIFENCV